MTPISPTKHTSVTHDSKSRFISADTRPLPPDAKDLILHEQETLEWGEAFYALKMGNHRRAAFSKDAATQFAMGFRAALALDDSRNRQYPSKGATWNAKRIEQFLIPGKRRAAIARQKTFVNVAEPMIKRLVAENRTPTIERLLS